MAQITAEIEVRINLRDRKALAEVMAIQQCAEAIAEDQPWNEEAKELRQLANRLLKRIEYRGAK